MSLVLHGYWRSGAAWRVRIALNLKELSYDQIAHDLRKNEQKDPAYRHLAPQGLVPALETGDLTITQSPAIIEWLEERYPVPPLLPANPDDRAVVRAMAALIGCDIHPLNNLRVLRHLRGLGLDQAAVNAWADHWITEGFAALELQVQQHGGQFAFGDKPTVVDCYLIPQVFSAERFGVSMDEFPRLAAVASHCATLEAFALAHASRQADAD